MNSQLKLINFFSQSKPKLKPTPSKRDHPDKSQVSPSASTSFLPPNSSFTYTAPAESTSYELEFANALERLKQSIKDRPISERLLLGEKYGVDLA